MRILISDNLPDDVLKRLEVLFATPKGSVVFDREFGLSPDIIDLPMNLARIRLTEDMHNLIKKYEPGYQLKEVLLENEKAGEQSFKVVITSE